MSFFYILKFGRTQDKQDNVDMDSIKEFWKRIYTNQGKPLGIGALWLIGSVLVVTLSCAPIKHTESHQKTTISAAPVNHTELHLKIPASVLGPRSSFSMAYDYTHQHILLHGGFGEGTNAGRPSGPHLSDTWNWDGDSWIGVQGSYLSLNDSAMVYDQARKQMVMFGGWGGLFRRGDTWAWSEKKWVEVTNSGPKARQNHALVFDEQRQTVLLFGGMLVGPLGDTAVRPRLGQITLGDTWEWNGSQWTQLHVTGPEPRWGHRMVYDPVRKAVLLFGGCHKSGFYGDTWIWEGKTATWSKLTPLSSPSPRCSHAMAFDISQKKALLFGGKIGDKMAVNDFWEWNGSDWSLIKLNISPKPRYDHDMAYDVKRQTTILYGGFDGKEWFRDTWILTTR